MGFSLSYCASSDSDFETVCLVQNVRHIGKSILEQVSSTRGLSSGLKFLCSSGSSLSAIFMGLKHGLMLVSKYDLSNNS